jgi:hypothetical protein
MGYDTVMARLSRGSAPRQGTRALRRALGTAAQALALLKEAGAVLIGQPTADPIDECGKRMLVVVPRRLVPDLVPPGDKGEQPLVRLALWFSFRYVRSA